MRCIGVSLALGVTITTLIAWSAALWAPRACMIIDAQSGARWLGEPPGPWRGTDSQWGPTEMVGFGVSQLEYLFGPARVRIAAGWPFIAFVGTLTNPCSWDLDFEPVVVILPYSVPSTSPEGPLLPTSPHWPGFCANSLFWGLVVLSVISFAPSVRRLARRLRGRCPVCGYILGDNQLRCSECGSQRTG
jgi:hypothetical protein